MFLGHVPRETPVPDRVRALAGNDTLKPVWRNQLDGVTFRASGPVSARFIKYGPRNAETTMAGEAQRLEWARHWVSVPQVLDVGANDTHEWLVPAALPGCSALDPHWIADPETAVTAVDVALRVLHDSLPGGTCPFDWGVPARIRNASWTRNHYRRPGTTTD